MPRVMGSRFGDVIWGRIVRGGLVRIERRRIPSRWARMAQGGVDCVALSSHCASRVRFALADPVPKSAPGRSRPGSLCPTLGARLEGRRRPVPPGSRCPAGVAPAHSRASSSARWRALRSHARPLGPPPRRDVHFALENDGRNCTFECEVHVWAPGDARGLGIAVPDPHRNIPDAPCASSASGLGALVQSTGGSVVQICHKGPDRAGAPEENR